MALIPEDIAMIYRGEVRGGVVVLPPEINLPEGTEVTVQPLSQTKGPGPITKLRNGVPVFTPANGGVIPDLELVNRLRDGEP